MMRIRQVRNSASLGGAARAENARQLCGFTIRRSKCVTVELSRIDVD
jgi:hypothetical protein